MKSKDLVIEFYKWHIKFRIAIDEVIILIPTITIIPRKKCNSGQQRFEFGVLWLWFKAGFGIFY